MCLWNVEDWTGTRCTGALPAAARNKRSRWEERRLVLTVLPPLWGTLMGRGAAESWLWDLGCCSHTPELQCPPGWSWNNVSSLTCTVLLSYKERLLKGLDNSDEGVRLGASAVKTLVLGSPWGKDVYKMSTVWPVAGTGWEGRPTLPHMAFWNVRNFYYGRQLFQWKNGKYIKW